MMVGRVKRTLASDRGAFHYVGRFPLEAGPRGEYTRGGQSAGADEIREVGLMRRWILGAVMVAVCGGVACGAKFNKKLDIGQAAPAWKDLQGTDGRRHSLDDLRDAKVVVVAFTCNHCPVAKAYDERMKQLVHDFRDRGVALVAINCSLYEADRMEAMKQRAADSGFNFPYLYNPEQTVGRAYGATVTPHFFVLDARRNIAYMGKFDDAWQDSTAVKTPYVREAVAALLAGRTPEIAETLQTGCRIEYKAP